ncbi:GNAT family N-acetyltransferase [Pseudonocardia nigra]|uniref:GNAT family N-acetyltransferase n=1 Tax=Pseudonocardia nigra TaxID=1921578 RepID=UPI001C605F7C|nr:GNAT family N-acetyltransferase [Pseudonocardia nigra]
MPTHADLVLRHATPEDASGIALVHVRSWRAAYAGLVPDEMLAGLSVDARAQMWTRLIADPAQPILVLAAPDVVGFAAFGANREDPATGELYAIYLDPGWWGRGAGRLLHDAVVEWLDDRYARSTLWVLRTNARAVRFYRAAGWFPDGTEKVEEGPGGAVLEENRLARTSTRRPPCRDASTPG